MGRNVTVFALLGWVAISSAWGAQSIEARLDAVRPAVSARPRLCDFRIYRSIRTGSSSRETRTHIEIGDGIREVRGGSPAFYEVAYEAISILDDKLGNVRTADVAGGVVVQSRWKSYVKSRPPRVDLLKNGTNENLQVPSEAKAAEKKVKLHHIFWRTLTAAMTSLGKKIEKRFGTLSVESLAEITDGAELQLLTNAQRVQDLNAMIEGEVGGDVTKKENLEILRTRLVDEMFDEAVLYGRTFPLFARIRLALDVMRTEDPARPKNAKKVAAANELLRRIGARHPRMGARAIDDDADYNLALSTILGSPANTHYFEQARQRALQVPAPEVPPEIANIASSGKPGALAQAVEAALGEGREATEADTPVSAAPQVVARSSSYQTSLASSKVVPPPVEGGDLLSLEALLARFEEPEVQAAMGEAYKDQEWKALWRWVLDKRPISRGLVFVAQKRLRVFGGNRLVSSSPVQALLQRGVDGDLNRKFSAEIAILAEDTSYTPREVVMRLRHLCAETVLGAPEHSPAVLQALMRRDDPSATEVRRIVWGYLFPGKSPPPPMPSKKSESDGGSKETVVTEAGVTPVGAEDPASAPSESGQVETPLVQENPVGPETRAPSLLAKTMSLVTGRPAVTATPEQLVDYEEVELAMMRTQLLNLAQMRIEGKLKPLSPVFFKRGTEALIQSLVEYGTVIGTAVELYQHSH